METFCSNRFKGVRDAAITTSTLVDLYADDPSSSLSDELADILGDYATLQYKLQHTDNPSGTFDNLEGLGEPKFEADGSAFTLSWGRPQRDGPALRAITLMSYLRAYNASHPSLWASDDADDWFRPLYEAAMPPKSIIKADLEYVSHFWNRTGFDLWEEITGLHFFTAMVQHRALREGAALALAFEDIGAAAWYEQQAEYLSRFMGKFWDQEKGHLVETLDSGRTGLDCGIILGSIHGFPSPGSADLPLYPPYSDEILVSLLAFVKDQRARFPINRVSSTADDSPDAFEGMGLGRYPEDIYDGYGTAPSGGNPWFLCTASAAEVLYRTAEHMKSIETLEISNRSLPFYSALLSSSPVKPVLNITYDSSSEVFQLVIQRLKEVGDEFLNVIRRHANSDGSLSEQFDRVTGFERGARDLTWSYGALLQAIRARKRVL